MFLFLAQAQEQVQTTNGFWAIIERFDTLIIALISLIAVVATAKLARRNDQRRDIWLKKAQLYEELYALLNTIKDITVVKDKTDLGLQYLKKYGINREEAFARFHEMHIRVHLWFDFKTYVALQDFIECMQDENSRAVDMEQAIAEVAVCMRKEMGVGVKRADG